MFILGGKENCHDGCGLTSACVEVGRRGVDVRAKEGDSGPWKNTGYF